MHQLKEEMIMNLDLKGFSPATKKTYLQHMKNYTRYFKKSPEMMGETEIKEYLHYLISERKVGNSYVSSAYSAIKFFYVNTLHREWDINKIPRVKKSRTLPRVLSKDEVKKIFEVTTNLKHRAILMTTYSAGLRVSETANLKITDIDSQRMQLHIEQGKGEKDRYSLLSDYNLKILREYWNIYHPNTWLFPGAQPLEPISVRSIQHVFEIAKKRAGIQKPVSVHTLRHSFATHLLEAGVDVYYIQRLMGHVSVKTTSVYIHICNHDALQISSPLDSLFESENDSNR